MSYPTHMEITTHGDGWWGAQEYTQWPQMFNESVIYHACIPLLDTAHAPGKSVYQELPPNHFVDSADSADGHVDPYDCETPEFGRMEETVLAELQKQAWLAIRGLRVAEMKAKACGSRLDSTLGSMFIIMLQNAVDRLTFLPCTKTHVLVTTRVAHRLILQMSGLIVYHNIVVPRLAHPDPHIVHHLLPVRGAFVRTGATAQRLHPLGIPF